MTSDQTSTADPQADGRSEQPIRILSLDGGGIYGMTGALWLRQLCEKDAGFLNGKDVDIFLGCSSGACNALLLAMHDRPRQAVLGGLLERFWSEPGTFSNSNPMGALLSFTGQVGWFGEADFRGQLARYMGRLRIGDLKHQVLISTYDWHGRRRYPELKKDDERPRSEPSLDQWNEMWRRALSDWASGWGWPAYPGYGYDAGRDDDGYAGGSNPSDEDWEDARDRHWKPKFFSNLRQDSEDNDYLIAEIAYGAATPPGFRALRGGLGDGASFSANPSVHGISSVVDHYRWMQVKSDLGVPDESASVATDANAPGAYGETCKAAYREVYEGDDAARSGAQRRLRRRIAEKHDERTRSLLRRIRMLSLGDGTRQPYFWQPDSNFGFRSWPNVPAQPWRGHWFGPGSYALQASDEEAAKIARDLLGRRYCRLDPGINDLPTVLAAYFARWPRMRAWMLENIRAAALDRTSRDAVDRAAKFLRSPNWTGRPAEGEKPEDEDLQAELARLRSELEATRSELAQYKTGQAGS